MFKISFLTGTALVYAALINASSVKTGSTVNVDGIFYYVPTNAVSIIQASGDKLKAATTSGEDLIPLTVIPNTASAFDGPMLQAVVANYTAKDDVFNSGFLQGESKHYTLSKSLFWDHIDGLLTAL